MFFASLPTDTHFIYESDIDMEGIVERKLYLKYVFRSSTTSVEGEKASKMPKLEEKI